MNDDEVVEVDFKQMFQQFAIMQLLKLPHKGKKFLAKALENYFFPWYELTFDQPVTSTRRLHTLLAEQVERDLSKVLWTHVSMDPSESEEFMVMRVLSQPGPASSYSLMVTLGTSQGVPTGHVFRLTDFMYQFRPSKPVTLENYNA